TWMNAICTGVELTGILIVIGVTLPYWGTVSLVQPPQPDMDGFDLFRLTMQGAVLTFFAFVGFEDLLNVAEEAKNPERDLPLALVGAIAIATVLYMAVAIGAVNVLPTAALAASKAALVDVVAAAAPAIPPQLFTGIGIFAVANTALLNLIMGSRLLYGMSKQGLLPAVIGRIHPVRQTPHVAIAVLLGIVILLMLTADIDHLAAATSLLLLSAFVVVNLSLVVLMLRPGEAKGGFEVPLPVPILGALICGALIVARVLDPAADVRAPTIAGVVLLVLAGLFFVARPKGSVEELLG
ncbi:MAG TPA: APC family permease, partial [Myxococcota bacterium]|nr:APC family permease [Myxococcota bacterium]